MKQIKYYILLMVFVGLTACKKDILEIAPTNILTKDQILNSPAGVSAYFAAMYYELPILDFSYVAGSYGYGNFPGGGDQYTANWTYESLQSSTYNGTNHSGNNDNSSWRKCYKGIRNVNAFILDVASIDLPADKKAVYTAEAKFLRAYFYQHLAKLYGGVPILLEPQAFEGGSDTSPLNVARNKEAEVWDQVKADLDFAAANMPETSVYGRANKYAALGLLSRTMLFAGSVAKFGTVRTVNGIAGIVGIDPAKATGYLQASYDASKAIMTSGKYRLFNNYPSDKALNFQMLFYEIGDKGSTNPEAIFCKGWDYESTRRTHSQDLMVLPDFIRAPNGYANRLQPSLEMVEMFEYTNGNPGILNIGTPPTAANPTGSYVHYATIDGPFKDKDPRFFGTVISSGQTWRGSVITGQRGVLDRTVTANFGRVQGNAKLQYYDAAGKKMVLTPTPIVGTGNSRNDAYTFWLKKYSDPVRPKDLCKDFTSETDWIDIRYGEILLNHAEAAFELGKPSSEALDPINQIRARAGIVALPLIDRDKIRNERTVELAFENQLFFDLRRWRTLTTVFNNRVRYGLDIYYDVQNKDYVFEKVSQGNKTYNQDGRNYYENIPAYEQAKNPLLGGNNPGY